MDARHKVDPEPRGGEYQCCWAVCGHAALPLFRRRWRRIQQDRRLTRCTWRVCPRQRDTSHYDSFTEPEVPGASGNCISDGADIGNNSVGKEGRAKNKGEEIEAIY